MVRLRFENEKSSSPSKGNNPELTQQNLTVLCLRCRFRPLADALPWRNDRVMLYQHFSGLRILRQPLAETLFCFLCSSEANPTDQSDLRSHRAGYGRNFDRWQSRTPNVESDSEGRQIRLRAASWATARYICQTARFLENRTGSKASKSPQQKKLARVCDYRVLEEKLPTALLFGAGRLDAFPIDTWVRKILTTVTSKAGN